MEQFLYHYSSKTSDSDLYSHWKDSSINKPFYKKQFQSSPSPNALQSEKVNKKQKVPLGQKFVSKNIENNHFSTLQLSNASSQSKIKTEQKLPQGGQNLQKTKKARKLHHSKPVYEISDRAVTPQNFQYYQDLGKEINAFHTQTNNVSRISSTFQNQFYFTDKVTYNSKVQEIPSNYNAQYESLMSSKSFSGKETQELSTNVRKQLSTNFTRELIDKKREKSKKSLRKGNNNSKMVEKNKKAMKKIQNRLKVCTASYHETQDLNKEAQHLKMRYENQRKAREQLKKGIILNSAYAKCYKF